MGAPSPVQLATTPPVYAISLNGSAIDSTIQVFSIETWTDVNKLPRARLVIYDGSAADEDFPISDTSSFIPGVALEIQLGYGSSQTTVFSGVIHRHGVQASVDGQSRLVVEATDKAMVMTLSRQNAVYQNTTDSSVWGQLISAAGLSSTVTSTSAQYESIVQYYASNWDFLVMRAQLNSMVVTVSAGAVTVAPPSTSGSPVLSLTFGDSILDMSLDMDASTQIASGAIQSFAWDPGSQALVQSGSASASVSTPGNISSATLAQVFNVNPYTQQTMGPLEQSQLTDWSSAELTLSQLSKIRGQVRFQGSALVAPGSMVTLAGIGDRFNGSAYVSGVHHRLAEGFWRTTVQLGLAPDWFVATAPKVPAPGASGQMPPINNVQLGTVKQINQDPAGEYRVLVTLPLLQAQDGAGVWARFGSFYASNGIGSNFYPEIGDEVVLAFLNGDPRYPVVLGSLYSKANPPPYPPTSGSDPAPNNTKSFMTKSKLHIDFIENNPEILITTPANQKVDIDDKAGAITIADKNGNSIVLNSSGITLKSASDITLQASGSISMTADNNVSINASNAFTAQANASAKVTASGTVQVSGAMVQLNP
jgi:Rhs element Vgr protein